MVAKVTNLHRMRLFPPILKQAQVRRITKMAKSSQFVPKKEHVHPSTYRNSHHLRGLIVQALQLLQICFLEVWLRTAFGLIRQQATQCRPLP
jgi:hypothetical protein